MREQVRQLLLAAFPELGGRVYHEGGAKPDEATPFIIISRGVTDPEEPFSGYSTPLEIWPYAKTFKEVDAMTHTIIATLNKKRFSETIAALGGITRQYASFYDGDVSPDFPDPAFGGARTRGLGFRIYDYTFAQTAGDVPDPVAILREWTGKKWMEIQTVTISGGPTGGTFTLNYNGQLTPPLAYNAPAATVQTALLALSSMTFPVTVTGNNGGPYTVTFTGWYGRPVNQLIGASAFTGGITPTITVTTTQQGVQTNPALWEPSNEAPAIYWRLSNTIGTEMLNWGTWITGVFRAHIIAPDYEVSNRWSRRLLEALSIAHRLPMGDGGDLDFLDVVFDSTAHPFRVGQVQLTARWGILDIKPDPTDTGGNLTGARVRLIISE